MEPATDELTTLQTEIDALDESRPRDTLRWAAGRFGRDVVQTCSFQHEGIVIAHMLRDVAPWVPVLFIDTGFHFEETLRYRDEIEERFGIEIRSLRPGATPGDVEAELGPEPWNRDPDRCCGLHKVAPLRAALDGVRCWINGRRRDQAATRGHLPVAEILADGMVKVNPLVAWTSRDTWAYMKEHGIPPHPLFLRGYASIGCAPCTRPILPGEDERAGRWAGRGKTECGIHTLGN